MRPLALLLAALLAPTAAADDSEYTPPHSVADFDDAKELLDGQVYQDHRTTFYCGCTIEAETPPDIGGSHPVDRTGCGVEVRSSATRANRTEWEHIIPASWFYAERRCATHREEFDRCRTSGGNLRSRRQCCERVDPVFRAFESDPNNLVPAVGELNGDRSNRPYGLVDAEPREYGAACDFEVDFDSDVAEPAPAVRGNIARIYFHMLATYGLKADPAAISLMQAWSAADPVDEWELERARRIEAAGGGRNRFVLGP